MNTIVIVTNYNVLNTQFVICNIFFNCVATVSSSVGYITAAASIAT